MKHNFLNLCKLGNVLQDAVGVEVQKGFNFTNFRNFSKS